MKKVLLGLGLAIALAFSTSPAYAYVNGWTLDLSGVGTGYGTYANIDRLVASGIATINQDFGSDAVLSNGDTFSEASIIQSMTYWTEPTISSPMGEQNSFNLGGKKLFAYASGLSGSVYNVSGNTADYVFNPGGIVKLYLNDSLTPVGATELAEFQLVSPSGGLGAQYNGGLGPNGTTDLTMLLNSSVDGLFTWNGLDLSDLPTGWASFGLVDTHNTIVKYTPTSNGFTMVSQSDGSFNLNVVPEPATMLLFGMGVAGLATRLRNKKNVA